MMRVKVVESDKNTKQIKGQVIKTIMKEFDVMAYLCNQVTLPVKREPLFERGWGHDFDGELRVIDEIVKRLRNKLTQASSDLQIKTVWGYGYKVDT